jgi:signal transduction histidine kinase
VPVTARHTVRFRLTLLYVGLFLASAACLLVVTYFLVAQQLPQPVTTSAASKAGTSFFISAGQASTSGTVGCPPPDTVVPPSPQTLNGCVAHLVQVAGAIRDNALNQLLIESGIALAIMAVASIGLGWLMAGRVLRPLRTITATARRISARSLDQRIAMTGPHDELRELGDTFDALLARLEASFRAQRQFVANASHELRTPLARQRTVLEVALRDRRASADSLAQACERALAASAQEERLIAAMLTLATGERGLDTFEPFDLAAIAEDALIARHQEATARGLAVTASISPSPTRGDPDLAERLVTNLIDNAIRHNSPDGHLHVATGTDNGRPFLTVSNTGQHIAPDQLPRMFQPFQRLGQTRAVTTGLGLGLAIVAAIAAAHDAALTARPNPDGGLTVDLRFPAAHNEPLVLASATIS